MTNIRHKKLSKIMILHYWKLTFRSFLFMSALILYIYNRLHKTGSSFSGFDENKIVLVIIWCIFTVEMILRFIPSRFESMGCQKQFKANYHPTAEPKENAELLAPVRTWTVIAAWFALNGLIGLLYYTHVIDEGILLLISLAYSVCDMICILFFCPFQEWMMKNKCCGSCRIYNWDFAMMFTPFLVIKNFYTWSLLGVALLLLIVWEIHYRVYPERFYENTNLSLTCQNCQEKLCHHKKSLRSFLIKRSQYIKKAIDKY